MCVCETKGLQLYEIADTHRPSTSSNLQQSLAAANQAGWSLGVPPTTHKPHLLARRRAATWCGGTTGLQACGTGCVRRVGCRLAAAAGRTRPAKAAAAAKQQSRFCTTVSMYLKQQGRAVSQEAGPIMCAPRNLHRNSSPLPSSAWRLHRIFSTCSLSGSRPVEGRWAGEVRGEEVSWEDRLHYSARARERIGGTAHHHATCHSANQGPTN